jgi:hypothetical protein
VNSNESTPRRARGERHPKAWLTDAQVQEMRDDYEIRHMTMRQIAEKFGASWHTVRHLLRYERRPFARPSEESSFER